MFNFKRVWQRMLNPFAKKVTIKYAFNFRNATKADIIDFPALSQLVPKSYFALQAKEKMELMVLENRAGLACFGALFWKANLLEPYLQLSDKHNQDVLMLFEFSSWSKRGEYFRYFLYRCVHEHFRRNKNRLLLLDDGFSVIEKRMLLGLGFVLDQEKIPLNNHRYNLYAIETPAIDYGRQYETGEFLE